MPNQGLERGDRAPDFVAPLSGSGPARFYSRAGGRPTVIAFCDVKDVDLLRQLAATLNLREVPTFAVLRSATNGVPAVEGVTLFLDEDDAVTTGYRLDAGAAPTAFVLDANLRVTAALLLQEDLADAAAAVKKAQPVGGPVEVHVQAPVLLIPNVLDDDESRSLIRAWTESGGHETGVEASDGDGRIELLDVRQKRRRDHVVTDGDLMRRLTAIVGRRVMPEILRAFHYRATRFEGFKIACYESESFGFFSPHRDNLSPSSAHRRFAVSVNLNDDYEGGHLRFPEFGPHLYRPAAGGGVVFSCSMLHEVTPVTEGRRFALLSFLFNREGARPQPAGDA